MVIGCEENIGSGFPPMLSAWNEKHWMKPELIEQPDLMQVKLVLHIEDKADVTKDVTKEINGRQRVILELIFGNRNVTIPEMSQKTNVTERAIKRDLALLQVLDIIIRIEGGKDGAWVIKRNGR